MVLALLFHVLSLLLKGSHCPSVPLSAAQRWSLLISPNFPLDQPKLPAELFLIFTLLTGKLSHQGIFKSSTLPCRAPNSTLGGESSCTKYKQMKTGQAIILKRHFKNPVAREGRTGCVGCNRRAVVKRDKAFSQAFTEILSEDTLVICTRKDLKIHQDSRNLSFQCPIRLDEKDSYFHHLEELNTIRKLYSFFFSWF